MPFFFYFFFIVFSFWIAIRIPFILTVLTNLFLIIFLNFIFTFFFFIFSFFFLFFFFNLFKIKIFKILNFWLIFSYLLMITATFLAKVRTTWVTMVKTFSNIYFFLTLVTEYKITSRIWHFFNPLHRMLCIA